MKKHSYLPDIFISYSRKDKNEADKLAELLAKEGWEVWKDNRINAGSEFEVKITEALNQAKTVVVLWSKNSAISEWVNREAAIALEQKKLIPVLIEECEVPQLFRKLNQSVLIDWQLENAHAELEKLFNGLSFMEKATLSAFMEAI